MTRSRSRSAGGFVPSIEINQRSLFQMLGSIQSVQRDFQLLCDKFERRQYYGSQVCARASLEITRTILARYGFHSTEYMLGVVKAVGKVLCQKAPDEFSIGNIIRRILALIREEHQHHLIEMYEKQNESSSLTTDSIYLLPKNDINIDNNELEFDNSSKGLEKVFSTLTLNENSTRLENPQYNLYFSGLKQSVLHGINEMSNEIDNYALISTKAHDFIHSQECVFTYGYSEVVESFLKAAANKRCYHVVISEACSSSSIPSSSASSPLSSSTSSSSLGGYKLAAALNSVKNLSITIIPDSNIFAVMGRMHKVILSPQGVLADGSAVSSVGHLMVATAAKEFHVPVIQICPPFTITPLFPYHQDVTLQRLLPPACIISYDKLCSMLANSSIKRNHDEIEEEIDEEMKCDRELTNKKIKNEDLLIEEDLIEKIDKKIKRNNKKYHKGWCKEFNNESNKFLFSSHSTSYSSPSTVSSPFSPSSSSSASPSSLSSSFSTVSTAFTSSEAKSPSSLTKIINEDQEKNKIQGSKRINENFKEQLPSIVVSTPRYDLISPEYSSIFVTSEGPHLPSFIFRQLSEYYHSSDYIL